MIAKTDSLRGLLRNAADRVNKKLRERRRRKEYQQWLKLGRPAPPPHLAKQEILKEYARKHQIRVLIETGTFMGDMVAAMQGAFVKIYSIELSQELFVKAQQRFLGSSDVELLQGDSGRVLGEVLPKIDEPALLWLDGHYSAGETARGEKDTPILEELGKVLRALAQQPGHIVLIDDARCFGTFKGYPSIEELREYLQKAGAKFQLEVKDDIIRVTSIQVERNSAAA